MTAVAGLLPKYDGALIADRQNVIGNGRVDGIVSAQERQSVSVAAEQACIHIAQTEGEAGGKGGRDWRFRKIPQNRDRKVSKTDFNLGVIAQITLGPPAGGIKINGTGLRRGGAKSGQGTFVTARGYRVLHHNEGKTN